MLQNAYFLAKTGADTAENERNFAENLPKTGNYPTGPGTARGTPRRRPRGAPPRRGARGRRGTPRTRRSPTAYVLQTLFLALALAEV